ncbi:MAG: phytanoyl-CoA dioxygenase family protein [Oligoflexales bacterium]|nr:phytanoyl-CoA dioxygenase family protein [Oligoflexales bacterium]
MKGSKIKDFFEKGYAIIEGLYSPAEIALMERSFNSLQEKALLLKSTREVDNSLFVVDTGRIHRIVWCCGAAPELASFATDRRMTSIVQDILKSPVFDQIICQAHFKLPGDEVAFPWHQDSEHRRYGSAEWSDVTGTGSFVQTLTAIDEVTEENSPLFLIPGSHKMGHLSLNVANNKDRFVDESQMIPALLKPGSTIFFHPYLIHASFPNQSDKSRRVFINGYSSPGANHRVYPGCGLGKRISLL